MKRIYFILTFIITSTYCYGQIYCGGIAMLQEYNFDNVTYQWELFLEIDSTNQNNLWQIGASHKLNIDEAFSIPNMIITDTLNSYTTNNNSSFTFSYIDQGGLSFPHSAELIAQYNVNTDSLNDYGIIEISPDNGSTWIDIINDTIYNSYLDWITPKPTFTGNSNGWQYFRVSIAGLGYAFEINQMDTILFRMSFFSDSIYDNLDGLAFDNFQFCNGAERIEEFQYNYFYIYPNPAHEILYVKRNRNINKENIKILTCNGQILFCNPDFNQDEIDLNKLNLSNGIYFIHYTNNKQSIIRKFVVNN